MVLLRGHNYSYVVVVMHSPWNAELWPSVSLKHISKWESIWNDSDGNGYTVIGYHLHKCLILYRLLDLIIYSCFALASLIAAYNLS